jgi:hypothetical protein
MIKSFLLVKLLVSVFSLAPCRDLTRIDRVPHVFVTQKVFLLSLLFASLWAFKWQIMLLLISMTIPTIIYIVSFILSGFYFFHNGKKIEQSSSSEDSIYIQVIILILLLLTFLKPDS